MRFGSASPGKFGERHPAHAGGRRRRGGDLRHVDRQLQREVREDVRHRRPAAFAISASRACQARRGGERVGRIEVVRPVASSAPRSCRRAGPSAGACAPARSRRRAAPRRPRRGAACPSVFGALRGKVSASPRARAAQGSIQGQSAQAGFFGVQMVAPRSISACAKSPRRCARQQRLRERADVRLGRRQFAPRPQRAARSPARHCRRPPPPARRTQSPRSPPRCRRRCRAAPRAPLRVAGKSPPWRRPPPWRRHAGCGRGRSSRARPRACSTSSSGAAASACTSGQRARKRAK